MRLDDALLKGYRKTFLVMKQIGLQDLWIWACMFAGMAGRHHWRGLFPEDPADLLPSVLRRRCPV